MPFKFKIMKYLFFVSLIAIGFACQYSGFTDLTPDDGFNTEFAFNVPALNKAIHNDGTVRDSGAIEINAIPDIYAPSPFAQNIQYIGTDTFAFGWQDYEPVIQEIHSIANGYDITNTTVSRDYKWLDRSQFYSNGESYLIPLFNSKGQRYWLQVFRQKVNWYQTYYTARGVWVISKPKNIDGDVS